MIARTVRALATTVAATVAIGMVGTTAAHAKPVQPGSVTGLVVDSVTPSATSYAVAAHWNPVANATKYRVAVTKGGATLVSVTVTTASWSGTFSTSAGNATLGVRAVITRKPGPEATVVVPLPDITAPTGSFSSSWVNATGVATITQDSLADDSPVGQVTRTVDWNDGSLPETWSSGLTLTHPYPTAPARYVPTVTLMDAAGNHVTVDVPAVVIADVTAPTGAFTVSPATAWATFTSVTLAQTALSDGTGSPADKVTRLVTWGDGTTTDWTSGATVSHVYAAAGSYTPNVTLTDEAHNSSLPIDTSAVVVSVDAAAPVVKFRFPAAKHSVKAWTTLRGKATDSPGTGVKAVALHAVEKRGTRWFAYKPASKTWVKASTKAKAFAKSGTLTMHTDASNRWSGKLGGLRKGTLVYKVKATDNVGNASAVLTHKATLTRR
jgi:hypothetical protein